MDACGERMRACISGAEVSERHVGHWPRTHGPHRRTHACVHGSQRTLCADWSTWAMDTRLWSPLACIRP